MNITDQHVVLETVDCLRAIVDANDPPAQAHRRLSEVGERHAPARLDLVWDSGSGDGFDRHYDALLRLARGGTLSLSYCRDHALPWPLRGAHRFGEADLLQVNDTVITVGQAIGHLESVLDDSSVSGRLIDACLIREELERNPVDIDDVELQRTMDAFRRTHRLYSIAACQAWMQRRGLSQAQFETLIADYARVARLRQRLTAHAVDEFFEANRGAFDTVYVAQIVYGDAATASRGRAVSEADATGFFDETLRRFAAETTGAGDQRTGLRTLERGFEPAAWVNAVFAATPASLVGPFENDGVFLLVRVIKTETVKLDDRLREKIQHLLLNRWLDERRKTARIEWFWHEAA